MVLTKSMPKSWITKTSIYHAALRLLNEHEIEDITIRSIAKEAGISVGSFYYYYKTKFDVYLDAYYFMDHYFENVVSSNLPDSSTWDQLMYYFDQYHYYNMERTPFKLYKLLVFYASPSHQQRMNYGFFRVLNDIVVSGQKRGEMTAKEPAEEITLFLLNSMRGIYRHWMLMDGQYDIDKMYRVTACKLLSIYMTPPQGFMDYRLARKTDEQGGYSENENEKTVPIGPDVQRTAASH